MAEENGAKIFKPPSTLKAKVGAMGPSAADLQAIKRAETAIASLTDKYLEVVQKDLANLGAAADKLRTDTANRAQHLKRVFQIAHDMRGQGGSFGYPLITTICRQLCRFIEKVDDIGEGEVEVVTLHVDALSLVIRAKMTKPDSQEAQAMLKGLELVIAKRSK